MKPLPSLSSRRAVDVGDKVAARAVGVDALRVHESVERPELLRRGAGAGKRAAAKAAASEIFKTADFIPSLPLNFMQPPIQALAAWALQSRILPRVQEQEAIWPALIEQCVRAFCAICKPKDARSYLPHDPSPPQKEFSMADLSRLPITKKWPAKNPDRIQLYSASDAERGQGVDHARRNWSA